MTVGRAIAGRGVRTMQAAIRPVWRRRVLARGRDRTDALGTGSALVLAPHPDDETLGCGALIARRRSAGSTVRVVIAADGSSSHPASLIDPAALVALRREESLEACRCLGVGRTHVQHLGVPDGQVAERVAELTESLAQLIDRERPLDVFVTSAEDWHPDHQALNRAARAAVAHARHPTRLFEYPVWWWVEGPWRRHPRRGMRAAVNDLVVEASAGFGGPRAELVATGAHLAAKREALSRYRSQVERRRGDPRWQVLDRRFTDLLLGSYEVYLPVPPAGPVGSQALDVRQRRPAQRVDGVEHQAPTGEHRGEVDAGVVDQDQHQV